MDLPPINSITHTPIESINESNAGKQYPQRRDGKNQKASEAKKIHGLVTEENLSASGVQTELLEQMRQMIDSESLLELLSKKPEPKIDVCRRFKVKKPTPEFKREPFKKVS